MFGFPTRSRDLYGGKPDGRKSLDDIVVSSRDLGMSITSFAPGSVTVKDGSQHLAVGFASYTHRFGKPTPSSPLAGEIRVRRCQDCGSIETKQEVEPGPCAVCGGPQVAYSVFQPGGLPHDVLDRRL